MKVAEMKYAPSIVENYSKKIYSAFLKVKSGESYRLNKVKAKLTHYYKILTDIHYRSHQEWLRDSGDSLRYNYPLNAKSVIFDVGGYKGEWAQEIHEKYNSIIYIFEPVASFAKDIKQKFASVPSMHVFAFGLSDKSSSADIYLDNNASSTYAERAQAETITLRDISEIMNENELVGIDLLKLNIEGGEYDVLERLIETGKIMDIKEIQVQFHLFVPGAKGKYSRISQALKNTHRLTWRYPFVWENWQRKDAA